MFNRAQVVDENLIRALKEHPGATGRKVNIADDILIALFESQALSRHLDLIARVLRADNKSFYTIGSSGHEGNALVGHLTRATDPAFLHYRSGGFMAERYRQIDGHDLARDTCLSVVASADDPTSGGRHKVWGSRAHWVVPQTSTIASQLPKALGAAMAIDRAKRLGIALPVPYDSIAICSFGDASANHSTAQGAFNAAAYACHQRIPAPVLFVCEDNGLGISVRTPKTWIESTFAHRHGLKYFKADGIDISRGFEQVEKAVDYCRARRAPVFLHLSVVRLLGHAGSDFEPAYRTMQQIEAAEARDPLIHTARAILESGLLEPEQLLERYQAIRSRVEDAAASAVTRPRLLTATQVVGPLAPFHAEDVARNAKQGPTDDARALAFAGERTLPEAGGPKHLAVQINRGLADLMAQYPEMAIFGEDVAQKGGVYHVTAGLQKAFGGARVFNTLLDEQTILGIAQGYGLLGFLPSPEIQYLAYLHNAADQIRGEACSTQFFSRNQFQNPMLLRIASFGYQKGFGGHFHNDNSIAALRDIPGLIIAAPSRGDDAVRMLRTCAALAKVDGRVVAFLEPIALYMTKDLYEEGDGAWQTDYPAPGTAVTLGEGRVYNAAAKTLAIVSYANGVYFSVRVAKRLQKDGIDARVIDLRWLAPLNHEWIASQCAECRTVLVVDEGRQTGGIAEGIITGLVESGVSKPVARVTGVDSYIPLGPAANLVLPTEQSIEEAARELVAKRAN